MERLNAFSFLINASLSSLRLFSLPVDELGIDSVLFFQRSFAQLFVQGFHVVYRANINYHFLVFIFSVCFRSSAIILLFRPSLFSCSLADASGSL